MNHWTNENIAQPVLSIRYKAPVFRGSNLCLFSSYSFAGTVEEYVYYYLDALCKAGFDILFISTSKLKDGCLQRLKSYTVLAAERDNTCPDFGSWKAGLELLDYARVEAILLANDSVFGPLIDLKPILSSMQNKYDVWGMTDNYEISHHLQSYFLHFNQKALSSPVFADFWTTVDYGASKNDVINRYEAGLPAVFRRHGFSLGAYASSNILLSESPEGATNPTLSFWKTLILKYRFPFLKRELLIKPQISRTYRIFNKYVNVGGWRKLLLEQTNYPVNLIEQFLQNYVQTAPALKRHATLTRRKILIVAPGMKQAESWLLLSSFLRWLGSKKQISAELIIPEKDQRIPDHGLERWATISYFASLDRQGRKNLKERLIDEAGIIINFQKDPALIQWFSLLHLPQVLFITESRPELLREWTGKENDGKRLNQAAEHFIVTSDAARQWLKLEAGIPEEKILLSHKFTSAAFYTAGPQVPKTGGIAFTPPSVRISEGGEGTSMHSLIPLIAASLHRKLHDIRISYEADRLSAEQDWLCRASLERAGLMDKVEFVKGKTGGCFKEQSAIVISTDNTIPLSALEAAAHGKPVFCFTFDGAQEYNVEGLIQFSPYPDIEDLCDRVSRLLSEPHAITHAHNLAQNLFSNRYTANTECPAIFDILCRYYDPGEWVLQENPPLTFITHLYYDNSWEEIKNKLQHFNNGANHFLFSISEACMVKDEIISDIRKTFTNAYWLLTSNIGKDIGGKMALIDIFLFLDIPCSFVIFLHDKQSPHSVIGETWKTGLFKIIDRNNHPRILELFKQDQVGIVGDQDRIINEYDTASGSFKNNDRLSKHLLLQFDMAPDSYEFLGGSMYWIRAEIIRDFFSKHNPIAMRENLEAGNVLDLQEERLAHTWERMFSWIATSQGYSIKGI